MSNDETVPEVEVQWPDQNDAGTNDGCEVERLRVITLTYGDMWFISDMMAGAKSPGALVSIGNFVGLFLNRIASYEVEATKLKSSHTEQYISLAKEFFVIDENNNPTVNQETGKWELLEGKTDEDVKEFTTRHGNMTTQFSEENNKLSNKEFQFDVPWSTLWNFVDAFLNGLDIQVAQRELLSKPNQPMNPQESANFVAALYSVAQKIKTL